MDLFRRKHHERDPSGAGGDARQGTAQAAPNEDLDWRPYDQVAETYARMAEALTAPPGGDLVKLLQVGPGARVLDVGAGTGAASRAAVAAAGDDGLVVGIDPSLAMLEQGRMEDGGPRYAAATAIDLPFRDGTFTHLVANFVLSHFTRYDTALFDMMRVLRSGGRMGVTAWARGEDDDDFSTAWRSVAEEFAEHEILQDAHDRAVPWEEFFSDPAQLKDALHDAGVRDIWVEKRDYRVEMSGEDYCADREISSAGRFLRQMLGDELWDVFRRRARQVFAERFPERFHDFHQALLAVGHKP